MSSVDDFCRLLPPDLIAGAYSLDYLQEQLVPERYNQLIAWMGRRAQYGLISSYDLKQWLEGFV